MATGVAGQVGDHVQRHAVQMDIDKDLACAIILQLEMEAKAVQVQAEIHKLSSIAKTGYIRIGTKSNHAPTNSLGPGSGPLRTLRPP